MFYTDARRRNSLDRSEEQTGQDQSVDEADIDPVYPTGLCHSIGAQCFSSAFIFTLREWVKCLPAPSARSIGEYFLLDVSQSRFWKISAVDFATRPAKINSGTKCQGKYIFRSQWPVKRVTCETTAATTSWCGLELSIFLNKEQHL